jgi:2-amino-4-hydroxy-6-hydroxymethyldihydropteridine diphosphokinase
MAHVAYVGLGANLGDARGNLTQAVRALARLPDCRLAGVSSLYRSAPIESSGPDYFNAVTRLETTLPELTLLHALQAIEREQGRERPYPNAPRTLDLDLLAYDQLGLATAELTLPHPRAHLRAFVLQPWAELAPQAVIGELGQVGTLLRSVVDQVIERVASADEWLGEIGKI